MKNMQELMGKIDPVVANATKENVTKLARELDIRDSNIFRAKLRKAGKLTPELDEVISKEI